MLSAAGIASIHFAPQVTQGSLARFVRGFPTGTGTKPTQLAEQLKAALQGDPHIHVNEVCFVPADSAVARSTVAQQIAAHTVGMSQEKTDELFSDPEKLLQLIMAAEGKKGNRGRGAGDGSGGNGEDSVRAAVDLGTAMVVVKAETEGVVTPPAMQIQAKRYMRWKTRK
jgi:hypothetical protein